LVDPHVIGMAVSAVAVVAQQYVSLLFAQDLRQPLGRLGHRYRHERRTPNGPLPWVSTRPTVGVPEMGEPRDAEDPRARPRLGQAPPAEPLLVDVRRGTETAVGREHQDDAVSLRRGFGHGPRGEHDLV